MSLRSILSAVRVSGSWRLCWALALLGLLIGSRPLPAAAQAGAGELWRSFRVTDGLHSGSIFAVLPAADGSIWVGTDLGAERFDGLEWEQLTEADGLPPGRVRAIAQAADGALWFGTKGGGVSRRSPDGACCQVWTTAQGLPSNDVRVLLAVAGSLGGSVQPGIWVGTAGGLVYLDGERVLSEGPLAGAEIQSLAAGRDGSLAAAARDQGVWTRDREGTWKTLGGAESLGPEVYALWIGPTGRIWAGSQNGLFYHADGAWRSFPLTESGGEPPAVFGIIQDPDGGLWIGTSQGLFYDPDARPDGATPRQWQSSSASGAGAATGLVSNYVRCLAFDGDGALWLGTVAGVNRFGGNIWQEILDPALRGQRVNMVLTDSRGRTWVGTERNGVVMWDGTSWRRFGERDGLPDTRAVSLFEDRQGRVWLGTGTGVGYWREDSGWLFLKQTAGLSGFPVYAMEQDAERGLWLAGERGLSRWDEATGFREVSEFAGKRVNAVHRSSDGVLWLGLPEEGIFRRSDSQWQRVPFDNGTPLKGVVVNGIQEGPDGKLLVGAGNEGLWQWSEGRWQRIAAPLPSPVVLTLGYVDAHLWIGTYAGLGRTDGRSWQSYNGDVLPSPKVLAMAPGQAGSVWIGTEAGLVRYRGGKAAPWVQIGQVNLSVPEEGRVILDGELREMRVRAGDTGSPPNRLVYLVQIRDQGDERAYADPLISLESWRLPSGTYVVQVQARDTDFNYSAPAQVTVVMLAVQPQVTLPWGQRVAANLLFGGVVLAALALGSLFVAAVVSHQAARREQQYAAELTARRRQALERRFNPYISGEPVRQPDMFFGRDELLRKVLNALHQNSIMIHGERRIGKTTVLYQLAEELRQADDPEWVFIPVSLDLEGTPQELFFHHLMDAIWGVLRAYLVETPLELRFETTPATEYTDREFVADLREILEPLRAVVAPRDVRIVLLIDEMDVINSYDTLIQQQLRRIFMSTLAQNLGAVVAGIQISKAWDRMESPWYNLFNEISLEPFTPEASYELLIEPVRGVYEWDQDALDFVVQHAEGRPHRLQQYGLEAVNHMLAEGRLRITLADVQAAHEVLERSQSDQTESVT